MGFEFITLVVIGTDCIGSCKLSNDNDHDHANILLTLPLIIMGSMDDIDAHVDSLNECGHSNIFVTGQEKRFYNLNHNVIKFLHEISC